MGVRGFDELLAVLPSAAAGPASVVVQGLADLIDLRHSALAPEEVRAVGELWERFTAQVTSGRLGVLAAIDARDDVIPKAKVGDAGAVFASHGLGQRRAVARRDAAWAGLLRQDGGDLPAVGAAFAAGDISTGHVEVAVRAHRALGPRVREQLMGCEIPDGDDDITAALRAALDGLSGAFAARVRLVLVVDAVLAHYARHVGVPELEAIATRIVATVNPPDPEHAHERRYLQLDQQPDGTWVGRLSCGAEQGLRLKRAIAAWAQPRPGKGIDQDGVEFTIPDRRDLGARQIDAITDIVNVALAKTGITLPDAPTIPTSPASDTADAGDVSCDGGSDQPGEDPQEPPPGEGETVVLREPGALVAPYPSADLVLVAGIDHVAAAWTHRPDPRPGNQPESFPAWLRDRYIKRRPRWLHEQPAGEEPGRERGEQHPAEQHPAESPPVDSDRGETAWLRRALSPYAVPARIEHAGAVDATTLQLLACNATVRAALLAPTGALLDLGRTQRLASAAQKTALLARDGGCVIPGCIVPGDACDAHHVQWWDHEGPTDLENLALVCGRHHTEIHLKTWQIQMRDGIPWIRPPKWLDRAQGLIRNAAHHPAGRDEAA